MIEGTFCLLEYLYSFYSHSLTWIKSNCDSVTLLFRHWVAALPPAAVFHVVCVSQGNHRWLSDWFLDIMSHSWCCYWVARPCLMAAGVIRSDKTVALLVNQQHSTQILLFQMFTDGGLLEFSLLHISEALKPRLLAKVYKMPYLILLSIVSQIQFI